MKRLAFLKKLLNVSKNVDKYAQLAYNIIVTREQQERS